MKKHWLMVARQKTSRKTKITEGSLYCSTLPYCDRRNKWKETNRKVNTWLGVERTPQRLRPGRRGHFADYLSGKQGDSENVIITADFYNTGGRVRVLKVLVYVAHQYFWYTCTFFWLTDFDFYSASLKEDPSLIFSELLLNPSILPHYTMMLMSSPSLIQRGTWTVRIMVLL